MSQNKLFQLITFDVYTALFDSENSLLEPVSETLGKSFDSLSFVRAWRRKQLEYALISNSLQQERISFEQITRRALGDTLTRSKLDLPESLRAQLVNAWQDLQPWPEAPHVLDSLKAHGYRLGLLSNGDTAMLHAVSKNLPPVFDYVYSSEQAGYYKPHPAVYALPLRSLQLRADEVLHVAGSATDALGAKAAGLGCAWSNRNHEPILDPSYPVDYNMPDLSQLLEVL
jgi:2-haloacid dehalogenase